MAERAICSSKGIMDSRGSMRVPEERPDSGTVEMELQGTSIRIDVKTPPLRRFLGLQPQHLGYLSLLFDATFFVSAGVGAAAWLRLGHLKHTLGAEAALEIRVFEGNMF